MRVFSALTAWLPINYSAYLQRSHVFFLFWHSRILWRFHHPAVILRLFISYIEPLYYKKRMTLIPTVLRKSRLNRRKDDVSCALCNFNHMRWLIYSFRLYKIDELFIVDISMEFWDSYKWEGEGNSFTIRLF